MEAKPDGHVEGEEKDKVNLGAGAEAAMEKLDGRIDVGGGGGKGEFVERLACGKNQK